MLNLADFVAVVRLKFIAHIWQSVAVKKFFLGRSNFKYYVYVFSFAVVIEAIIFRRKVPLFIRNSAISL